MPGPVHVALGADTAWCSTSSSGLHDAVRSGSFRVAIGRSQRAEAVSVAAQVWDPPRDRTGKSLALVKHGWDNESAGNSSELFADQPLPSDLRYAPWWMMYNLYRGLF